VRGFHTSNSLPLWQQAPKRELPIIVLVLLITIVLTTTIVFLFAFILIHQNPRAKIVPWITNQIMRNKDPRLMERRV
jgi:hypothetical protein